MGSFVAYQLGTVLIPALIAYFCLPKPRPSGLAGITLFLWVWLASCVAFSAISLALGLWAHYGYVADGVDPTQIPGLIDQYLTHGMHGLAEFIRQICGGYCGYKFGKWKLRTTNNKKQGIYEQS